MKTGWAQPGEHEEQPSEASASKRKGTKCIMSSANGQRRRLSGRPRRRKCRQKHRKALMFGARLTEKIRTRGNLWEKK